MEIVRLGFLLSNQPLPESHGGSQPQIANIIEKEKLYLFLLKLYICCRLSGYQPFSFLLVVFGTKVLDEVRGVNIQSLELFF
jgi:hypothetical protein